MSVKNKSVEKRKAEFVQHFMVTKNSTESAKRVGYSEKSAYNQGYRLMNDDEVKEMLAKEMADSKERHLGDHDAIIERLKEEALGDVAGHTAGSRVKALEILMKYYGMIDANQKLEVSMADSWFNSLDFLSKEDHLN